MTDNEKNLIRSLRSDTCPACGRTKTTAQTFCRSDYFALPEAKRKALYNPLGSGYAEAVEAAMKHLKRENFILPRDGSE